MLIKYTNYRNKLDSAFENKIHVTAISVGLHTQRKGAEHIIYVHFPMFDTIKANILTSAMLFCWRHTTIHSTNTFCQTNRE